MRWRGPGTPTRATPWGRRPADWELVPWRTFARRAISGIRVGHGAAVKQVTVRVRHRGVVERPLNHNRRREILTTNQTQVRAGEFIISKIDARNGACGFIPAELDHAVVTQDFPVYDVSPTVSHRFLDHLTATEQFWRLCESVSDGTTNRVRLNLERFDELVFPLPPIEEQCGIAAILDAIDEAVAACEAVIEATERLRKAFARELLTGGIPGRHSEWKHVPGAGTVPSCWDVLPLGSCGRWLSGGTPSKKEPRYWHSSVPWVSPKDMKALRISESEDHISPEAVVGGATVAEEGTILMVVRGLILARTFPVGILTRPAAFNQDIKALCCRADVHPDFLVQVLAARAQAFLAYVDEATHGTKRLPTEALFSVPIALPPEDEQTLIVSAIGVLSSRLETETGTLRELRGVKAALAEALLTGELRMEVVETEAVVR